MIISVDALSSPMTGIGRYTWELGQGLKRSAEVEELRFFSRTRFVRELRYGAADPSRSFVSGNRVSRRILRGGYRILSPAIQAFRLFPYSRWLFHSTNFYLPAFPGRKIVTIHDLSVLRFPHCHPADRVAHLSRVIKDATMNADFVIADSEFIRREIIGILGVSPSKVVSVPLACGDEFRPRNAEETSACLAQHHLRHGEYSLIVSTVEPRKNISVLIRAYAALPEEIRSVRPLVVVGHAGWQSEAIHADLKAAEKAGWLRYFGYAPQGDLPYLYSGARCFIFPSLYEGFGLPVLEAMASGIPVLTCPDSAMEEMAGDSAEYCAPDDPGCLAFKLERLLSDDGLHARKCSEALSRAGLFSWDKTVERTLEVYRGAV